MFDGRAYSPTASPSAQSIFEMWSWRAYAPLVDQPDGAPPDTALLLGEKVDVQLLDEICYVVDPSVELRRVTHVNGDGSSTMTLRVRCVFTPRR